MVAIANKSTVPYAIPRRLSDDLDDLLDAIVRNDDRLLRKVRNRIIKNIVKIMAVADLAGRWRFLRQLKPKRFQTVEDQLIRIHWGMPMAEAVEDIVRREPRLRATGAEVAELYLSSPDSFSIAGISVDETLHKMQGMLTLAIARGMSQSEFKDAAQQILQHFTRPRLETIFRTNVATAYSAGRLQQAQVTDEVAGFKRITTHDSATRENHRKAEGMIYSKSDPNLGWFLLPWGYNCRCTDAPITIRSAKARGADFNNQTMITPTWPAGAFPDPRFEGSGIAGQIYGLR